MTLELFETDTMLPLAPGAVLLRGFATRDEREVLADLESVIAEAPLRHMTVPGGHRMSVAMTNSGVGRFCPASWHLDTKSACASG